MTDDQKLQHYKVLCDEYRARYVEVRGMYEASVAQNHVFRELINDLKDILDRFSPERASIEYMRNNPPKRKEMPRD